MPCCRLEVRDRIQINFENMIMQGKVSEHGQTCDFLQPELESNTHAANLTGPRPVFIFYYLMHNMNRSSSRMANLHAHKDRSCTAMKLGCTNLGKTIPWLSAKSVILPMSLCRRALIVFSTRAFPSPWP